MRTSLFFVPDPSLAGHFCQTGLQKGTLSKQELLFDGLFDFSCRSFVSLDAVSRNLVHSRFDHFGAVPLVPVWRSRRFDYSLLDPVPVCPVIRGFI